MGEGRICHLLLNFKPARLFVGVFWDRFVNIGSHESRDVLLVAKGPYSAPGQRAKRDLQDYNRLLSPPMKMDHQGRFIRRSLRKDRFFLFLLLLIGASVGWWALQASGWGTWKTAGRETGQVAHKELTEISGIAVSRRNRDILWAHNDSGGFARVFALRPDGSTAGVFRLAEARARDWEDLAIGPGPQADSDYLYVADTGNNALTREIVTVYRVPEPDIAPDATTASRRLTGVEALPFRFPGRPHECETLLVDPLTSDLYLVSRDRHTKQGGMSSVFLSSAPQEPGVIRSLELVARFAAPYEIKGGDLSPDGRLVVLRAHSMTRQVKALLWSWDRGTESLSNVFQRPGIGIPARHEPQGEAIAFTPDRQGYFTISEGQGASIYRYDLPAGILSP